MKSRYILFRRAGVYYAEDTVTRKQHSLRTKNESFRQPVLNLQIARAYLTASDPAKATRTWQGVMEEIKSHGRDSSQKRYVRAMKSKAFDVLRDKKLLETNAEDFLAALKGGQVSVAHFLKRLHNLALALGWIPLPVLVPKLWPKPQFKPKRAITLEEHQRILAAEKSQERQLYYQLLWEVVASQSDAAELAAENIDRATNCLTYFRKKTGEQAQLAISRSLAAILEQLPQAGPLFPNVGASLVNLRAAEFYYLCKRLKIGGVTLHNYRYAWAERAKSCGYPERFAQEALRHNSKAVHRAYARLAKVLIPAMEDYELRMTGKLVALPVAA